MNVPGHRFVMLSSAIRRRNSVVDRSMSLFDLTSADQPPGDPRGGVVLEEPALGARVVGYANLPRGRLHFDSEGPRRKRLLVRHGLQGVHHRGRGRRTAAAVRPRAAAVRPRRGRVRGYFVPWPPSTGNTTAVMTLASSEARKRTASVMFCIPTRHFFPASCIGLKPSRTAGPCPCPTLGVTPARSMADPWSSVAPMVPGAMALTLIPNSDSSLASALVRPTTPCLEAT